MMAIPLEGGWRQRLSKSIIQIYKEIYRVSPQSISFKGSESKATMGFGKFKVVNLGYSNVTRYIKKKEKKDVI